ncbi:transporter [Methylocella sp.]|uniref:transporter n=1 Tax=Methylocella sp. TaxID=1978226 RepID=UPI003784F8B0
MIDLPPTRPGFIVETMYLGFWDDASASRQIPVAGQVTAGLNASATAIMIGGLYTFAAPDPGGAFYSLGASAPFVDEKITAQIVGPLGRSITRSDRDSGLGDITIIPAMLAWKNGDVQFSVAAPVYAPTGAYEAGRLANVGLNYWTFDPTISLAYNGSTNGFNAAAAPTLSCSSRSRTTAASARRWGRFAAGRSASGPTYPMCRRLEARRPWSRRAGCRRSRRAIA